jgi:hypothetical protein
LPVQLLQRGILSRLVVRTRCDPRRLVVPHEVV